jgi:hypothetical protein
VYCGGSVSSAPSGTWVALNTRVRISETAMLRMMALSPMYTVWPNSMSTDPAQCDVVGVATL